MRKIKKTMCAVTALAIAAMTACGSVENDASGSSSDTSEITTAPVSESMPESSSVISESAEESTADSGIVDSGINEKEVLAKTDVDFDSAAADFSVELFKNTVSDDNAEGKNTMISPESVMMALGMAANGADGDTLTEIMGVLSDQMAIGEYNDNMKNLIDRADSAESVDFNIANSLWARDGGFTVKDSFSDVCRDIYGAEARFSPFDESAAGEINGWVNEKTNGMIPGIVNEISDNTIMMLINAVAFEGKWQIPYEDGDIDENGEFTNVFGETENAAMLNGKEYHYIEDGSSSGFVKYYEGGEYAFMAILPDDGVTLGEYIDGMTGRGLISMYEKRRNIEVYTKLPEFTYEYSAELNEPLYSMGIQKAFEESADFSAISDSADINISSVFHKTFIKVDREGTKAAGATSIAVATAGGENPEPKYVYLDRPFIYAIIDTESGLPMFLGTVNTIN